MRTERPELGQLLHRHLQVSDMKRSIDFYTSILGYFYDHGVREMAWLTRHGMLLTLSPGEPQANSTEYSGFVVASADELDTWYAWLRQRGVRLSAPPSAEDGRAYFFLYDPDDYAIAISIVKLDYPERIQGNQPQR